MESLQDMLLSTQVNIEILNSLNIEKLLKKSSFPNEKLKYYMVGDSPKSDIIGGNANGFETFLVKTGNY